MASPVLSRGEGSHPLTCWQCSSQCSAGCCWLSLPRGSIVGSCSTCSQAGPPKHEVVCLSWGLVCGGILPAAVLEICLLKKNWCCLCSVRVLTAGAAAYEAWSNLVPGTEPNPQRAGALSDVLCLASHQVMYELMVCFKKLECFCCSSNIGLGI